jgi:anaerobic dimethyl sulfoxide reductase subunit B (iron-sulfur subunit)
MGCEMKKAIYLDMGRCVGCGACVVACMDQNDLYPEKGQAAFRRIFQVEEGKHPKACIQYISFSCMHCEDSPCLIGCPTGAITRNDRTGAVVVRQELCIGCHSCALACPFGVPRYDREDKMFKCVLCSDRVEAGLMPACVRVCPMKALSFESINNAVEEKQFHFVSGFVSNAHFNKAFELKSDTEKERS